LVDTIAALSTGGSRMSNLAQLRAAALNVYRAANQLIGRALENDWNVRGPCWMLDFVN